MFHAYAMAVWGQLRRTGVKGVSVVAEEVWDLDGAARARREGRLREAMADPAVPNAPAAPAVAREPRFRGVTGYGERGDRPAPRADPARRPRRVLRRGRGAEGPVARAASRSSSAAPARAAWSRAPPTRRARYGVRSAMPAVRARRLCPDAVFLPPDFEAYRTHSNRFREVLLSYTPLVEPISLDEAFLDVGGATTLFGAPPRIAATIRADVAREVGVTCSVGVASTKFVAKLASDHCKPDGLLHVPAEDTLGFLDPLPVGRLWGVGEKTARPAGRLGDPDGRRPRDGPREPVLERLLGEAAARHLTELAHGIDEREVDPVRGAEVGGHEETFDRDLDDIDEILRELLHLSGTGGRAAARGRLPRADRDAEGAAGELHDAHAVADALGGDRRGRRPVPRRSPSCTASLPGERRRIRLLGVQASGLEAAGAEQLALLRGERWGDVERALDRIERAVRQRCRDPRDPARSRPHAPPRSPAFRRFRGPSAIIGLRVVPRRPEASHAAQRPRTEDPRRDRATPRRRRPVLRRAGRSHRPVHAPRPSHPLVGVRVRRRAASLLFLFVASVWFAVVGFGLMLRRPS